MMQDYAARLESAADKFVTYCRETHGFTEDQAEHILAIYRKEKVIKLDGRIGQFDVKHGAYLEREPMQTALTWERS